MKKFYILFLLAVIFNSNAKSQVSISANQSFGCLPATIGFSNSSSVGDYYIWNFGDGSSEMTTGLASATSHNYTRPGVFNVYVDAYDNFNNYLGFSVAQVTIEGMPVDLYATDTTVCPGDETSVDIGYSNSTDITWDFGDGVVLSNVDYQGVRHVYGAVGIYTINVTAVYPTCGTQSNSVEIYVGNSYPLEASNAALNLQLYPNTVCPNDEVEISIPYMYPNYYINYGDGITEYATDRHRYVTAADYPITVTLINGCGNTLELIDTVHVQNGLPINISNSYSLVYVDKCINTNIEVNAPFPGYQSYFWNFGGGNTSNAQNAMTSFPNPGNYPISLTMTNGCGNSAILFDTVNILTSIPVSNLTFDGIYSTSLCPNDGFFMSAEVDGGWDEFTFEWDFGDGNTSNAINVQHSYAAAGTYLVSLTATNFCGNSATITETFTVGANVTPIAANYFAGVPDETLFCPGDSVLFVFGPGTSGASVYWDFGDGDNGIATNTLNVNGVTYNIIKHAYSSLGVYTPELTFTNSCGNSFNLSQSITIANGVQPNADFFEDALTYNCQGQPITFLGMGGNTFIWDFGDGSGSLITNSPITPVEHIYEDAGTYSVTVKVINGCGLSDEVTNEVIVPESKINITTNSINSSCNNEDGKAIAVVDGGNGPYEYLWSNGDTGFMADTIPAGIYLVNVEDKNGCKNFAIATVSDDEAATILTAAVVNPSCYGASTGAIDISVIGNSAPYNYVWSNGSTNEDVNQLEAGPHEVTVTDANGCISTKSILVEEPGEVIVTTISENSACGGNDGKASVAVSGSSAPYNYIWSNGGNGPLVTGLSAGIYDVVVIDANGCIFEESVSISEGDLNIVLDSITGTGCVGDLANIYVRVFPNGTYSYDWSNGATTEDVSGLVTGNYTLEITDQNTFCKGYAEYSIMNIPTTANEICIVTVDSISNTNRVVWEKDLNATNVSHYNIYKESSQSGVYYLVDQVDYDSLSNWTDPVSNPQVRAWRYKISVVDDCGNESVVSSEHKTIHLTVNEGINNSYNLIWDHYDGLNYSTYNIYRKTNSSGWQLITSVPSNLNSYTDQTPPVGTEYYRVEAITSSVCDPTRAGVNTSRSNVKNTPAAPPYGQSIDENLLGSFSIYPNPTNGIINVETTSFEKLYLSVYNSMGEMVFQSNFQSKTQIDLSAFSNGIYLIQLENENDQTVFKIIKD